MVLPNICYLGAYFSNILLQKILNIQKNQKNFMVNTCRCWHLTIVAFKSYPLLYPSTHPSYFLMHFKVICRHQHTSPPNASECISPTRAQKSFLFRKNLYTVRCIHCKCTFWWALTNTHWSYYNPYQRIEHFQPCRKFLCALLHQSGGWV